MHLTRSTAKSYPVEVTLSSDRNSLMWVSQTGSSGKLPTPLLDAFSG